MHLLFGGASDTHSKLYRKQVQGKFAEPHTESVIRSFLNLVEKEVLRQELLEAGHCKAAAKHGSKNSQHITEN